MPTPRMTTSVQTTFASKGTFRDPAPIKAPVLGVVSDNAGFYYLSVLGSTVKASTTTDAPIKVGDVVWVQQTSSGWIISGTA